MAETRSTFFGLPRYSSDGDEAVTRTDWEEMVTRFEERVAFDDGVSADTLPATLLKPGRYARQNFTDGYALHRRSDSAWEWVGGTIQPVRVRMRSTTPGDTMLSSDTGGVTPTVTATWKASGEIATAAPLRSSAVGAFGAALDADVSVPATTGRAFVRTSAENDRGLVVAAHSDSAGALFTARTAGGSDPTTIDSRGRLRSSAPVGLGQSSPIANVPLAISPASSDLSALDVFARAGDPLVPGLRLFRTAGDNVPIGSVLPDLITLGRADWAGAAINLRAPSIGLFGTSKVTGTLEATENVTFAKKVTAEAGKVVTFTSNETTGLRSSVKVASGTVLDGRDLRHSLVWRKRIVNINFTVSSITSVEMAYFTITPSTTCYLDLNLGVHLKAFAPGSSGAAVEPVTVAFGYRLLNEDASEVLFTSDQAYELTVGAFDITNKEGKGQVTISDICTVQVTAGTTYRIQLWGFRADGTSIATVLRHIIGTIREAEYMGS